MGLLTSIELMILDFIQLTMRNAFFDQFWSAITRLGNVGAIWIAISIILLISPKTRSLGIVCTLSLLSSVFLTNIVLKNLVGRMRPFYLVDLPLLIKAPSGYSFPSGHASSSFAIAFVFLRNKTCLGRVKLYRYVMLLAGMVAFSRLYLYVHYPSDVLSGVLIGYISSLLAMKLYSIMADRSRNQIN
ncbi:phosphatase PAP2 family protein [Clostridia bacterium]|nr:phosphatase PAP2 family protein [Clostridia bacterium]